MQEAKVLVLTPGRYEDDPPQLTIRQKLKRDLRIPKKKPKRPKTHMDHFADDADKMANTLERMK